LENDADILPAVRAMIAESGGIPMHV